MTPMSSPASSVALQEKRAAFFERFPNSRVVDESLRSESNPNPLFFMVQNTRNPDLKDVGFAIGRLGGTIERQFNINGEIAFFFAPWKDFQRRSFNVMTTGLPELAKSLQVSAMKNERFTPSLKICVLVSHDSNVMSKIDEWQEGSASPTRVVPLVLASDDLNEAQDGLLKSLRYILGERDLYRTQNPVTGEDFFGRKSMLRPASAALESDENIAILGLRRSGKTSVLRELKRQLLPRRTVVTMGDFQVLQSETVHTLAGSLLSTLLDDLRNAKSHGLNVRIGDVGEQQVAGTPLTELSDRLRRVAARNSQLRIIVALDEIESAARIAKSEPEQIRMLLGALRTAAQASPNVCLAFSGVANRMFRNTVIGDGQLAVDNPMFGQVNSMYITAFEASETGSLLRDLGKPMFLDWDDEAIQVVHRTTGGIPYFVRTLASEVRGRVKAEQPESMTSSRVSASHVTAALPAWRKPAGHDWQQLTAALGLHYPEAAALLDPTLTSSELNQWILSDADAADAAEDLAALGLIASESGNWRRTETLEALEELATDRQITNLSIATQSKEDQLLSLIRTGENQKLELKETFRINVHTEKPDKAIEKAVARAIAGLLNGEGGAVMIGVHDSGEIKGVDRDLRIYRDSLDALERWVMGDLLSDRIGRQTISRKVQISWPKLRGKVVCLLHVERADEPAWLDDQFLFVRVGNQTVELMGRRLAEFICTF